MKSNIYLAAIIGLCMAAHAAAVQPASATGRADVPEWRRRVDACLDSVARTPDWLVSRLQMYWHSHATDVYVNGEAFDHAGGQRAPEPTVKFNGTRGTASAYNRPRLEDVVPYDDDGQSRVTFVNPATGMMEKAHPSKTGCNISSLNRHILGIARDAARIYNETADGRYAQMAERVFDVYMRGIYHRNVPTDLNHGHQQTLVGLATFEVIHEDEIDILTEIYRLLHARLTAGAAIYDAAFKKWADCIIANGVPHNNWNLFQAGFIMRIAMVLADDGAYSDGRGRQYYLDYIINKSSVRQWGLRRMAAFGYDGRTAIWYESPGYSCTVTGEFADFANRMDRDAGVDVFADIPVLRRSIFAAAQYLMPNRMVCGFGDTHPNYLSTRAADAAADYSARRGDTASVAELSAFKAAVRADAPDSVIGRYVSPLFHAPNVSWLIHRSGMNPRHDLSISLNASLGNHQHANGISMELYGKGFVLGPDAGIGKHLYSGLDYAEYYSQMPAHNTVCVDGISSYPVMMSNHAFTVEGRYPKDDATGHFTPATYSQVSFTEPESGARQMRTNGIVKTSGTGGYYVDIFRSDGKKLNDYFYHNLGQDMRLTAADGSGLNLQPTDELAFAGGHLYAYSYIYNKVSTATQEDVRATFTTTCPDGRRIDMTMWMQGAEDREVFSALSPANMEYERLGSFIPYDVRNQPVLTYVARQHGEAWNRPFVAVFEPSDSSEPSEIARVSFFRPESKEPSAVGIRVELKSGRTDYIFSAPVKTRMKHAGMTVNAAYAVISNNKTIINE